MAVDLADIDSECSDWGHRYIFFSWHRSVLYHLCGWCNVVSSATYRHGLTFVCFWRNGDHTSSGLFLPQAFVFVVYLRVARLEPNHFNMLFWKLRMFQSFVRLQSAT
eukprot:TRINITY_DN38843_c0_g2_i1.p2 TRINITY_DN38843_c0_g2~~TRINITY_DN38843_c0_g2_i1.p2  ORF type:complete len:107 (+),score=4.88 TRINITY_DN38843_c0_g2_i1:139-459(+)